MQKVVEQYEIVKDSWQKASKEKWKLGIWQLDSDEEEFVEDFFAIERSPKGSFSDVFLRFESSFFNFKQYETDISKEYTTWFSEDGVDTILVGLKSDYVFQEPKTIGDLLAEIRKFQSSIPSFESLFVIHLAPYEIQNLEKFENLLINLLDIYQLKDIRLMLIDSKEQPIFERVLLKKIEFVRLIAPKLEMAEAFRDVAMSGNPNNLDVAFRQNLIKIMDAAGNNDTDGVNHYATELKKIATKINDKTVDATALIVIANARVMLKEYPLALIDCENVIKLSRQAIENGNEDGRSTFFQGFLLKAAIYTLDQDIENALLTYQKLSDEALEMGDLFHTLEGYRLTGMIQLQRGKIEEAWEAFMLALQVALHLSQEMQEGFNVLFVGKMLYFISENYKKKEDTDNVNIIMTEVAGSNWQNKIEGMDEYIRM